MATKLPYRHDFSASLENPREDAVNCMPLKDKPNFSTKFKIATEEDEMDAMKAKILGHAEFRRLLEAYVHCVTVGSTPEIVFHLEYAALKDLENRQTEMIMGIGMDPELDRFMVSFCEMLISFREKLAKPFKETMAFFTNIEAQFNSLNHRTICPISGERIEGGVSMGKEYERSEERELKDLLLRKYSGHLGLLRQRLVKKKKGGKLPKEARQKLLHWWDLHQNWPYPSESERKGLAECTRLDPKQVSNWFINQRKRHRNPNSEDTEFDSWCYACDFLRQGSVGIRMP